MSKNFVQNSVMRSTLLGAYRLYARSHFWRSGPRVLVNSIPKAGTHLLASELENFPELENSRLHLELSKVKVPHTRTPEGHPVLDLQKIRQSMQTVRNGQFFSAHLLWSQELANLVDSSDVRMLFMTRDPRDILVSRLHYVKGLRRHWLHAYVTEQLDNDVERYRLFIKGRARDPFVMPMREMLAAYLPWTTAEPVLTVRFEDLVGERGGGSPAAKQATLSAIAQHCGLAIEDVQRVASSAPRKTATLRKGQAGTWRGELPGEIAAEVSATCGSLLTAMGYDPH